MKYFFTIIALGMSFNAFAEVDLFDSPFDSTAYEARSHINAALVRCGLEITDPHDRRLPPPRIIADEAIINRRLHLLAYYRSDFAFGTSRFVYSNPDGGMQHQISFNRNSINFVTPNQGTVARAMQATNPNGYVRTYYCGNYRVSYDGFEQCIADRFINFISGQLCRYAE